MSESSTTLLELSKGGSRPAAPFLHPRNRDEERRIPARLALAPSSAASRPGWRRQFQLLAIIPADQVCLWLKMRKFPRAPEQRVQQIQEPPRSVLLQCLMGHWQQRAALQEVLAVMRLN